MNPVTVSLFDFSLSSNVLFKAKERKEASDEFKQKQENLLRETLKKIDIVICTALIPGKKAPVIVKESMIKNMQPGSVIYDLAAVQGGNTAVTKVDEEVDFNGIKIMGEKNILNKILRSRNNHDKEYIVTLNKSIKDDFINKISNQTLNSIESKTPLIDLLVEKASILV